MNKQKQHYDRIQSKKKRDKDNECRAFEKTFNKCINASESLCISRRKDR